ncbi:MAG: VCBS repeat-containing protein, partial [Proteobacteria bacterium]|nr:VCBS repeat-containing protein [Pseudomonadota bacterium]
DLDGDGRQDLYGVITDFTEEDGTDRFFWNRGELEFDQDDDLLEGGLPSGQGFDAVVFDVDGDTWLDVYVVNDMGEQHGPNALLRNTGGGLEDASDACACGLAMSGMGASVGDYDRDGLPDLYVTATSHNLLLQGQDDGTFVDVSNAMGADPVVDVIDMGWGSAMVDHDNDGDLDIVTAQGDFAFDHASGVSLPINLLSQQDGSFVDLGAELGLQQEGLHRAVIPIDWNEDGVLDLVISQAVERPLVYLSDSCTADAWLAVGSLIGSKVV